MSILQIEGGARLSGSVDVEGNKNAALPLLAACMLTTEECTLTNVPRIKALPHCASAARRSRKTNPTRSSSDVCVDRCC
jgi:UDP-N-acetylglucosamine 1-carboxyvinyltransferase